MTFNKDTVRLMRVFKGFTQEELGQRVAASAATISQIESGREPTETLVDALAVVLKVKREFFYDQIREEFTEDNCNFRHGPRSVERLRRRVLAQGTLFAHAVSRLQSEQRIVLPAYNVPLISAASAGEIEKAAEACRELWGLGIDTPIALMGRVLETKAGVMLTRLKNDDSVKLDAFSRRSRPGAISYIVLNPAKGSATRARFDMAHELGHLVLHADDCALAYKDREAQADLFASAFLLPRNGFRREFKAPGGRVDWGNVFGLKDRWKVSAQAIVMRAYRLNLIDAVEYRRAYKTISARGWLKQEPHEPEPETPELFAKAVRALWSKRKIGVVELSDNLHWSVETFQQITGLFERSDEELTEGDKIVSLADRLRHRPQPSAGARQAL